MARGARLAVQRLDTRALVCGRHPLGEADLIVRLFTEEGGMVSVVARGARRASRRFASLEPMHSLTVRVELPSVRELGNLVEASVDRPRLGIMASRATRDAAGPALRWVRDAAAPRAREPMMWRELNELLDALDGIPAVLERGVGGATSLLVAFGMRLLVLGGWALELDRCVRCGKPCPTDARVVVHIAAGGVVCRACDGSAATSGASPQRHVVLRGEERRWLVACACGEEFPTAGPRAFDVGLALIDEALRLHSRGDAT